MTLEEATQKVKSIAETHAGKLGSKASFKFAEGVIHIDDTVSPVEVSNNVKTSFCTMNMSLENFGKILNGDMNPMMAFMTGKMKIDGDKGVAMKLAGLF